MKKKDIITLTIAFLVIVASFYGIWTLLFPKNNGALTKEEKTEVAKIPKEEELDDKTYNSVSSLHDYGKPTIEGVGKGDLFGGF